MDIKHTLHTSYQQQVLPSFQSPANLLSLCQIQTIYIFLLKINSVIFHRHF